MIPAEPIEHWRCGEWRCVQDGQTLRLLFGEQQVSEFPTEPIQQADDMIGIWRTSVEAINRDARRGPK